MLAFGFEETNMYPKAELYAKKVISERKIHFCIVNAVFFLGVIEE